MEVSGEVVEVGVPDDDIDWKTVVVAVASPKAAA